MKRLFLITLTLLIILLSGCTNEPPQTIEDACGMPLESFKDSNPQTVYDTGGLRQVSQTLTGYFDTVLSLTLLVDEHVDTDQIFECVEMIYKTVHQHATSYALYEGINNVARINEAPQDTYIIDPILAELIEMGIHYQNETEGLFDISYGPIFRLWGDAMTSCNEENTCARPLRESLEAALLNTGVERISLNNLEITLEENMNLELGGIAKGYGAGLVSDYLRASNLVKGFLLNAGTSNIEVYGNHPIRENKQWLIGLRDPDEDKRGYKKNEEPKPYARVFLNSGEHIVTSGDYQRYFEEDDILYHHIIDPRTLEPGREMRSITVIGPDGVFGDVLSTTAFLYPPMEAIALVESYGYEAIIYGIDGTIYYSSSLEERIEIIDLKEINHGD